MTKRVVFLGDSLTAMGLWQEWFPDYACFNQGVGGETTADLLKRLDAVGEQRPDQILLLIGTNDIHTEVPDSQILANLRAILERIGEGSPANPSNAKVVVQGLLPRTLELKERIDGLNREYATISEEYGAQFIDVTPALADQDGALRADFTDDMLHLTPPGYEVWVEVLKEQAFE